MNIPNTPPLNNGQWLIHEILKIRGYSITRIAKHCGLSRHTITRVLHNTATNPQHQTFDKILRLYCQVCVLKQTVH